MNRNSTLKSKRAKFIKLTDINPKEAAKELSEVADALGRCTSHRDKIFALSQIFCVSESTIENDLYGN